MTNMMSTMRREEEEVVDVVEAEEEEEEFEEDEFDAAAMSQHELALLCARLLEASRNNNRERAAEECVAIREQIRAVRAKDARRAQALRLAALVGCVGAETDAARAQMMARMLVLAAQASLLSRLSTTARETTMMMRDYFPNAMQALAAQHSRVDGNVWTTTGAEARAFHAAVAGPLEHDSRRLL